MKDFFPRWANLVIVCCLLIFMASCTGKAPENQLVNGKLRPCPEKPNCVSSEEDSGAAQIAPLTFKGPPETAWKMLKETIRDMGGEVQQEENVYLRAIFTSRLFRFVDDVEFRMDTAAGCIHVRSASRIGYSDLGVNRKRVERLRTLFQSRMQMHS